MPVLPPLNEKAADDRNASDDPQQSPPSAVSGSDQKDGKGDTCDGERGCELDIPFDAARCSIVHPTCDSDIFIPSVCPGVRAEASLGHGVTLFSPGLGRVYADALPAVRCFYFARFRTYKKAMTVPNAMNAPMVR
ncbi:hypothetical protein OHA63_24650 [Streptomyces anulatus]|uniref:hypothetical protein n=1 Tax=Streptomyces anulatus TaxID=1892 RepID=UPI002E362BE5|nr:hypothetical protein [Streptomyces anulatus]